MIDDDKASAGPCANIYFVDGSRTLSRGLYAIVGFITAMFEYLIRPMKVLYDPTVEAVQRSLITLGIMTKTMTAGRA
jgi:hypothetical protein